MHTILKWLKSNSDEHFQLIQINAITAFVNLVTNSVIDYVSDAANQILEMTVGNSDGDRLQEILHSHLLSLCFFVVDEEINKVDRFVPLTLFSVRACISTSVDVTSVILANICFSTSFLTTMCVSYE